MSTWPLRASLRLLRRLRLGRRGVLELELGGENGPGGTLHESLALLESLALAREDPRVRALLLRLRPLSGGWATLGELREALMAFKAAGKPVLVHLEVASLRELYLVSGATRIWLSPSSQLLLGGMGAGIAFYGELLDRVGLVADIEAAGAFKSFGEPYVRRWASQPNRDQVRALLGDLQDQVLDAMADARGLTREALEAVLASSPLAAEDAVMAGLVDGTAYVDQVGEAVEQEVGEGSRRTPFALYGRLQRWERWLARMGRKGPQLVVMHLEGPVVHAAEGMGGAGNRIDSDDVVPALEQLLEEDQVAGLLLYVNSPGGSALASDLIARGVELFAAKKPVVAVFGDVSASGGYYLSAPAHEVIARPGTITGSIGVVGGKLVFGEGLARVGVHYEVIPVGPDPGMFSPWARFTDDQRRRFRGSLERTYARFIDVVAKGRGVEPAAVEPHAQGRVWTGQQALERGLVTGLGGLDHGLERLRTRASLEQGGGQVVHLRFAPPRWRLLTTLMGRSQSTSGVEAVGAMVEGTVLPPLLAFLKAAPGQPLALLPWRFF